MKRNMLSESTSGAAYCWGANLWGQLGHGGTHEDRTTPVAVLHEPVFASVSAGSSGTCGVTTSHVAYCWGIILGTQETPTKS